MLERMTSQVQPKPPPPPKKNLLVVLLIYMSLFLFWGLGDRSGREGNHDYFSGRGGERERERKGNHSFPSLLPFPGFKWFLSADGIGGEPGERMISVLPVPVSLARHVVDTSEWFRVVPSHPTMSIGRQWAALALALMYISKTPRKNE